MSWNVRNSKVGPGKILPARGNAPTFWFKSDAQQSSLSNLSSLLTINGSTVSPSFRFLGQNASASAWVADDGESLALAGSGAAPTTGKPTPLVSSSDQSVLFNTAKYYQDSGNTYGDITTEDFVLEMVVKLDGTANATALDKRGASGAGYLVYNSSATALKLGISDATPTYVEIASPAISGANVWHYLIWFMDRSGSGICYANGNAGTAGSISSVGTITKAAALTLGAKSSGTNPYDSNIAYVAMWKKAGWLDTHLQATVAQTRFAQLCGVYPTVARGTKLATAATRASVATLDKYVSSARQIFRVSSGWMRQCQRKDTGGTAHTGFLAENAVTQLLKYPNDFGATPGWTPGRASWATTAVVLPDGSTSTTCMLKEDATASNDHYAAQSVSFSLSDGTKYTFSALLKASNRNWVRLRMYSAGDAQSCCFNLATGAVGTASANAVGGTQDWGNGWYRCWFYYTKTGTENQTPIIDILEADNDAIFSGGNQDSFAVAFAQIEAGTFPTSWIPNPTAAASVSKAADVLYYKGDDGSIRKSGSPNRVVVQSSVLLPNCDSTADRYVVSLNDGGSSADHISQYSDSTDVALTTSAATGGNAGSVTGTSDIVNGAKRIIETRFSKNSLILLVDGSAEGTADTSCDVPDELDRINIGSRYDGTLGANGLVTEVKIK